MTLPEGFYWAKPYMTCPEPETVLWLGDKGVARMFERVDGAWFVHLDYHLPYEKQRRIDCTGWAPGRAGVETWALRHEERLRREVAAAQVAREASRGRGWDAFKRPAQTRDD